MTILSLLLLIHLDRAVKSLICLNPGFNVNSVSVVIVTNFGLMATRPLNMTRGLCTKWR